MGRTAPEADLVRHLWVYLFHILFGDPGDDMAARSGLCGNDSCSAVCAVSRWRRVPLPSTIGHSLHSRRRWPTERQQRCLRLRVERPHRGPQRLPWRGVHGRHLGAAFAAPRTAVQRWHQRSARQFGIPRFCRQQRSAHRTANDLPARAARRQAQVESAAGR